MKNWMTGVVLVLVAVVVGLKVLLAGGCQVANSSGVMQGFAAESARSVPSRPGASAAPIEAEALIAGEPLQRTRRDDGTRWNVAAGASDLPEPSSAAPGTLDDTARARAEQTAIDRLLAEAPTTALAPGEELWVIPTDGPTRWSRAQPAERVPAGLRARFTDAANPSEGGPSHLALPVYQTRVVGDIDGYLSAVSVTQRYENPFDRAIEAEYVFPLPDDAAVHSFVMTIGDRKIRGVITPRDEAQRVYDAARRAGYRASLMSQERPNIFTQRVANIQPGEGIDVDITYYHTLRYRDDAFEFVFPTTVGPRYNPAGSSDPVRAVPCGGGAAARGPGGTTVEYLDPSETTDHRVTIDLDIDARLPISEIRSPTHAVEVARTGETLASVRLASTSGAQADRDFVLRIGVRTAELRSAFLHTPDATGASGTFSVMLVPPADERDSDRRPVEFIFVIDGSGSMSGEPFAHAREAVDTALTRLEPGDTFNVVRFASGAESFRVAPVAASESNLRGATRWLNSFRARGGTEAIVGIREAMRSEPPEDRERVVVFMTDGMIGNETEVLSAMNEYLGDARVFSFGVGSSPNRYLMDRMARLGRGASAYLGPSDSAERVMAQFFDRVSSPALRDVVLDVRGVELRGVYPSRNLDVLAGRPMMMTGRYFGALPDRVRVRGVRAGREVTMELPVRAERDGRAHPALPTVWARTRIADMANAMAFLPDRELPTLIEATALEYDLLSAYTSFVAVDLDENTGAGDAPRVRQAVRVPRGVRHETTVGAAPTVRPGPNNEPQSETGVR